MNKPIFQSWKFKSCTDTDGVTWHWAEYYFYDEQPELLVGKSPMYAELASDFYCLQEDAVRIATRLYEGQSWESVCITFRQAW